MMKHRPRPVRVIRLLSGVESVFRCSVVGCQESPVGQVTVAYHLGGMHSTLWCLPHLPDLERLEAAASVETVELTSVLGVAA